MKLSQSTKLKHFDSRRVIEWQKSEKMLTNISLCLVTIACWVWVLKHLKISSPFSDVQSSLDASSTAAS